MPTPAPNPPRRNGLIAAVLAGVIGGMLGLSFAAVPLYRLFCQATGYGGTPQIGPAASPGAVGRTITVRFNADVNSNMPWKFSPVQPAVTLHLGEEAVAYYAARNPTAVPVNGVATYNVTPDKVARYFHKTACFCFDEQTLAPGQEMSFPLSFWVDPAIADDPSTRDIGTITLSYTFFRALDDAAIAKAGPHVGPLRATP
ncbi:MAG: cytochrome c oxidase assembly protein [Acetobacteraceae bacterium]|nr:cytochrome c oxidase assembly protein [Acetobacteraceae bacterium]